MGIFGGLIGLVLILIISFIFSAMASSFANHGQKEPGIWVMLFTFIGFSSFGIWLYFFV